MLAQAVETEPRPSRLTRPRNRLWTAAVAWFFYAPVILLLSLSRTTSTLLFLVGWAVSLGWVLAGYRNSLGLAFTRTHAIVVAAGLSFGIFLLASSGLAGLLAVFGLLPSVSAGS